MAGVTLDEARAHYADALAALEAARLAVSIGDGGQTLQRAGLSEIRREVATWARTVRELEALAAGVDQGRELGMVASWD